VFSYVGYQSSVIQVGMVQFQDRQKIRLTPVTRILEELVILGNPEKIIPELSLESKT
jgi:hypothetical protein